MESGIWRLSLPTENAFSTPVPPEFSKIVPTIDDNRYPVPPHDVVRSRWMQGHDRRRANR